mmetsp:Transcript_118355/g.314988  ORF Transcript_118355/g.314988 Transcript_118355/m.314988 type:complete len:259 (-) Transcript_118355:125-901(-)
MPRPGRGTAPGSARTRPQRTPRRSAQTPSENTSPEARRESSVATTTTGMRLRQRLRRCPGSARRPAASQAHPSQALSAPHARTKPWLDSATGLQQWAALGQTPCRSRGSTGVPVRASAPTTQPLALLPRVVRTRRWASQGRSASAHLARRLAALEPGLPMRPWSAGAAQPRCIGSCQSRLWAAAPRGPRQRGRGSLRVGTRPTGAEGALALGSAALHGPREGRPPSCGCQGTTKRCRERLVASGAPREGRLARRQSCF